MVLVTGQAGHISKAGGQVPCFHFPTHTVYFLCLLERNRVEAWSELGLDPLPKLHRLARKP